MGILKKSKPKYCVVIGHTKKAQGAVNKDSGVSEFTFNEGLADKIIQVLETKEFFNEDKQTNIPLKNLIDIVVVTRDTLKELPNKINKLNPKATISLHCNSVAGSATGTEVLVREGCKDSSEFGKKLLNNLYDALQLRNRGIKELDEEDRGGYLVNNTNTPCVISEPFFLSNDYDFDRALEIFEELAEAVVLTFLNNEKLYGVIL